MGVNAASPLGSSRQRAPAWLLGRASPARSAAWLLAAFALVLALVGGVIATSLKAGYQVRAKSMEVSEQRIPALREIGLLQQAVAERVAALYLYYATTERDAWAVADERNVESARRHLAMLATLGLPTQEQRDFTARFRDLDMYSAAFDEEMRREAGRDWDGLREELARAQTAVDNLSIRLAAWSDVIRSSAQDSGEDALGAAREMEIILIAFSVGVAVVSAFVLLAFHARLRDQAALRRRAYFDDLTGLPNRRSLNACVDAQLRADRSGTLWLLRIEHHRRTVGLRGHDAAEQLLVALIARLRAAVPAREDDWFRLDTDTLALVGDGGPADAAGEHAQVLLNVVERPLCAAGHEQRVAVRVGICRFPDDATDADAVMRNAEAALLQTGPAPWFRYEQRLADENARWLALEQGLRGALESGGFELHYQPKVDAKGSRVVGAEALVRWRRAGLLVSPGEFIPVAELSGLIVPLGNWVLGEACRQWQAWARAGRTSLPIAVNVSARQFQDPAFADLVMRTLREFAIPAGGIELEITEAVAADAPEHVVATMQQLKASGVSIAIDDFGTGFSSLAQLERYPLDTLKIDQAFVRRLDASSEGEAIVRLILGLARELRLKVVAEGVETETQQRRLGALGCDVLQGFRFSRPLPPGDYLDYLAGAANDAMSNAGRERFAQGT